MIKLRYVKKGSLHYTFLRSWQIDFGKNTYGNNMIRVVTPWFIFGFTY